MALACCCTAACSGSGGDADATPEDLGSETLVCEADAECISDNPCLAGTCEGGVCQFAPADGECSDGNVCTGNDTCVEGACVGTPVECDDGLFCNGLETCSPANGSCLPGTAPVVDDGVDCTVDECSEEAGAVLNTPDNAACDDTNQCTLDTCVEGVGCSSMAVDGPCDDGNPCTVDGLCVNGECQEIEVDCNDDSLCNGMETCDTATGDCLAGTPVLVDDGFDCTVDECVPATGEVLHTPQDEACDDANACTLDNCLPGEGCVHDPSDASCDDGNLCTLDDYCMAGECTPGSFVCFEDCTNKTDDDQDLLVDCEDPDCLWDIACLGSGDTCQTALPLNEGEPLLLGGSATLSASTQGKAGDYEGSCSSATGQSADTVHSLVLGQALGLSVSLDFEGTPWAAVYILADDCQTEVFCAAASSGALLQTVTVLPAGSYFVVVDSAFAGDAAAYTLKLGTFAPAAVEVGCGNKVDDDADGATDCADSDCKDAPQCAVLSGDTCADAINLFGDPVADNGQIWTASYQGKTSGMGKDLAGSCDSDTASASDMVFTFTLLDPMKLTASHDFSGALLYPALYLLSGGCAPAEQVACATALDGPASLALPLPAGTYYLVVDAAYPGDAGAFSLSVELAGLPDKETACGNEVDDDLDGLADCLDKDCAASPACTGKPGDNCKLPFSVNEGKAISKANGGDEFVYSGTTAGMNNDFTAPCDPDTATNADVAYKFVLKDPMLVTLSHDFDGTLYPTLTLLAADCGSASPPLACVTGFSGAVTIAMGLQPGTYYAVVDSAFPNEAGPYTFKLVVETPAFSELNCMDGKDDDLDGAIDCKDTDCASEMICLDEYEPNNTFQMAYNVGLVSSTLGFVTTQGAMIYPAKDEDWFQFDVPGSSNIIVNVVPEPGYDIELSLTDKTGKILATSDTGFGGDSESITVPVISPTHFGAMMRGFSGKTGNYMFSITVNPAPPTEWDCSNNADDDLDGDADCDDPDCAGTAVCGAGDTCDLPLLPNNGKVLDASMDGVQLNYQGTTVGYADDLSGSCSADSALAPDAVWMLTLDIDMDVTIQLDFEGIKWPSLYIVQGWCGGLEVACAAGGEDPIDMDVSLEAGTYYFVVDGNWPNDASEYSLSMLFSVPPLTEFDCADSVDNDLDGLVDCLDPECAADPICKGETCVSPTPLNAGLKITAADSGLALNVSGDTSLMADELSGSCSPDSGASPDAVYSFVLADKMDVTATLQFSGQFWPAVYLFKGDCNSLAEAGCAATQSQTATLKASLAPGTYFVVVDGNFEGVSGAFSLGLTFIVPPKPPQCLPGDVVVTEIMKNPVQVSDSVGEWIELYNATGSPIDLNECILKDDDTDSHVIAGSLILAPGGYAVLGPSSDKVANGGVTIDYVYSSFFLGNTVDEVVLVCSGKVIDSVVYTDPLFPALPGAAMQLDPDAYSEGANDAPGAWCNAVVPYGIGDKGTPGADNLPCVETLCNDTLDDDLDGALDCLDTDCASDPVCPESLCADFVDNDLDLLTDCEDPDCAVSPFCADSDGDGVSDAADLCPGGNDLVDVDLDGNPDDCEVNWAGEALPLSGTAFDTGSDITVSLQVYMPGVTDAVGQGAGISVLMLYTLTPGAVDQELPMAYNQDKGNNDVYVATVPASLTEAGDTLTAHFEIRYAPPTLTGIEYLYNNGVIKDQAFADAPFSYPISGDVVVVNPGDVIFTEIMQNPLAIGDSAGEWFELYNTTTHPIDLEGWTVTSTNDVGPHVVDNQGKGLILLPDSYIVFVRDASALGAEQVPVYNYAGALNLGNGIDSLAIVSGNTTVDQVTWDDGVTFPDPNGASMGLSFEPAVMNHTANDTGTNWCTAVTLFSTGDAGTPGKPNEVCP
jgi:hypothetical protein